MIFTGVSGSKYYISDVKNKYGKRDVVNLTALFGPGNEPTQEDFETNNPEAFRMIEWCNNRERP